MPDYPTHTLRPQAVDPSGIVLAIILVSTIARLLFAGGLDYGVDEAYAVAVSRQFQWSFFDHPPIAFWTAGAMQSLAKAQALQFLFGDSAPHWLIRLPFVLAFSVTEYLVYRLGKRLFSPQAGLWALVLIATTPFFFASAGSWIVPDGPVDLFLAASALILAHLLYEEPAGNRAAIGWIALGLTFGLATLSKYHAFLFAAGAVLFILATPHRKLLARPWPWVAGLVALALFSPVIYWNATHGWISIVFQSGRSGVSSGLHPDHIGQMLAGEAAYLLPWTLVILIYALVCGLVFRSRWLGRGGAYERAWFLASLALPAIVLFTVLPLFGARGLPHWPMPGWLFAFPITGAMLANAVKSGWRWPIWFAGGSAALLGIAGIAIVTLFTSAPVAIWLMRTPGMLGYGTPMQQLIDEGADWKGLHEALGEHGLAPSNDRFVVTFRWFNAARISADLGQGAIVTVFNRDARGFAFLVDQTTLLGKDAVVISEPLMGVSLARDLAPYFQSVDPPETITIKVAGGIDKQLVLTQAHRLIKPYPLAYGATRQPAK